MKKLMFTMTIFSALFLNAINLLAAQTDPRQFVGDYEVIDATCTVQGEQCSFSNVTISITDRFASLTIKMDDTLTGIGEENCRTSINAESTSRSDIICHQTNAVVGGIHIHHEASIEKMASGHYTLEFSSSSSDWYDNLSFSQRVFTLKKIE